MAFSLEGARLPTFALGRLAKSFCWLACLALDGGAMML